MKGPETYLVVLVTSCVVLTHPHNEIKDGDERPDGVRVPSEHDIAETDIVVGRNMACGYAGKGRLYKDVSGDAVLIHIITYFLVELDIFHNLERKCEVAKQDMDT